MSVVTYSSFMMIYLTHSLTRSLNRSPTCSKFMMVGRKSAVVAGVDTLTFCLMAAG